jgi:hypothetical protein
MPATAESYAKSFVRTFIVRAIRDAHDWEDNLRVVPDEGCWHVETDIPTSAQSCWLYFDVIESQDGFSIDSLQALRSGTGLDASSVYVWDEGKGAWQLSAGEASV